MQRTALGSCSYNSFHQISRRLCSSSMLSSRAGAESNCRTKHAWKLNENRRGFELGEAARSTRGHARWARTQPTRSEVGAKDRPVHAEVERTRQRLVQKPYRFFAMRHAICATGIVVCS